MADSPTAYWRLGESSGSTMNDASGNGYNGSYSGTKTLGEAAIIYDTDTCVLFDGSSGYGSQSTVNTAVAGTQHATLEAWINRTSSSDTCQIGFNTNSGYRFEFSWHSDGNLYAVAENGGTTGVVYTALGGTGTHHIALAYDGTQASDGLRVTIYIDGQPVSNVDTGIAGTISTTLASSSNLGPFYIGHDAGSGLYFNGHVDEVAVYDTTLSAAKVLSHFLAGRNTPLDKAITALAPVSYITATIDQVLDVGSLGLTWTNGFTLDTTGIVPSESVIESCYNPTNGVLLTNNTFTTSFTAISVFLAYQYQGVTGSQPVIFANDHLGTGESAFWFQISASSITVGSSGGTYTATYSFTVGTTYAILVTFNSSNIAKIYINGTLIGTSTNLGAYINREAWVWGNAYGLGSSANGYYQRMAVWNKELTSTDATKLYTAYS